MRLQFHLQESSTSVPVIATLDDASKAARDAAATIGILEAESGRITDLLLQHGAILFRGLPISTAAELSSVSLEFGTRHMDYVGGTVPRTKRAEGVFTSTELDRRFRIQLHNELAYQRDYPDRILFFCQTPALQGGETTVADTRRIYRDLEPSVRERFDRLGVRYVRVFQEHRPMREWVKQRFPLYFHLTWAHALGTDDREVAERRCAERGMNMRWRENGDLEVWNDAPATIVHPVTGEKLWFNHANNLHANRQSLGRLVYYFRKLAYRSTADHPNQVYFGDGQVISQEEIAQVHRAIDRHTVPVKWERGDLLLLDNRLAAHGRNPFQGPREVWVSMLRDESMMTTSAAPARKGAA